MLSGKRESSLYVYMLPTSIRENKTSCFSFSSQLSLACAHTFLETVNMLILHIYHSGKTYLDHKSCVLLGATYGSVPSSILRSVTVIVLGSSDGVKLTVEDFERCAHATRAKG
jgi:hypothetical protein